MSGDQNWPWWPGCFALVGRPPDDEPWTLAMWWSEEQGPQLLFGWAFPQPAPPVDVGPWTERTVKRGEHRVRRLVLNTSFGKLAAILDVLSQGMTLADASDQAGIPHPRKLVHACLGRVLLSGNEAMGPSLPDLVAAPWRLLPSRNSCHTTMSSPSASVPAMRTALVRVDKESLLPQDRTGAHAILEILDDETGLSFVPGPNLVGRDLIRLGDLELLLFRHDPHHTPGIRVVASRNDVEVVIDQGALPEDVELCVRCRQTHAGAIIAEEARRIAPGPHDSIRFALTPLGASGALIEIWVSEPGSDEFRLIYEHDAAWIRQVATKSIVADAHIALGARWIENWASNRRDSKSRRSRATAMISVKRVVHISESAVGAPSELWQLGEASARAIADHLKPANSGALWISRMSEPGSDGRMRLVEWFRKTFGNVGTPGGLVLIDPYFDSSGIDIIARLESPKWKIIVVTTLSERQEKAASKSKELAEAYARFLALIGQADLNIFTVKPERLHDRIVLEIDDAELPRRGFNLSNSLCSATKKHGLLITPIPRDILGDVADAVSEMIDGMQPFLSRPLRPSHPFAHRASGAAKDLVNHEDVVLAAVSMHDQDAFAEALEMHALWVAQSRQFYQYALDVGPKWAMVPGMPQALEALLEAKALKDPRKPNNLGLIDLAQMTIRSFAEHRNSAAFWTREVSNDSTDWALHLALWALFIIDPARFTTSLNSHCQKACKRQSLDIRAGHARHLAVALNIIGRSAHSDEFERSLNLVIQHGLDSDQPLVRSLLSALLGQKAIGRGGTLDVDSWSTTRVRSLLLRLHNQNERLVTLADWHMELGLTMNDRQGTEFDRYDRLQKQLIEWMLDDCPEKITGPLLTEIVMRCNSGRLGASTQGLIDEFFIPLNCQGNLIAADLLDVWLGEFESRIKKTLEEDRFFDERIDPSITEMCSWLLTEGEHHFTIATEGDRLAYSGRVSSTLELLKQVWKNAARELDSPFARTLRSERWRSARRARAWINSFALLTVLRPSVPPAVRLVTEDWIIAPRCEDNEHDPSGLFPWLQRIRTNR